MNEVRQLFRYTLPGIVCVIELISAFMISDFKKMYELIHINESIGVIIGIFLGSGGLGYIFANIYFALYWSCCIAIDHLKLFSSLSESFEIVDSTGKPLAITDKKEAWKITLFYWFSRFPRIDGKKRINIKAITERTDNLTNIAHGQGATLIGTILFFLLWIILSLIDQTPSNGQCIKNLTVCVIWIIILISFFFAYLRTIEFHESLVNTTMANMIKEESSAHGKVQIYYVR